MFFLKSELFKSNDFFKFLKKIVIMNPRQNSNPASARKKNVVVITTKSSLIVPNMVTKQYNTTQTISEKIITLIRLLGLSKNINTEVQKINVK